MPGFDVMRERPEMGGRRSEETGAGDKRFFSLTSDL